MTHSVHDGAVRREPRSGDGRVPRPQPAAMLGGVRVCIVVSVLCVAGACTVREADASVSLPVTWEALVKASTAAAIVTPMEARAVWEDGRICTYTHVHIERALAGELGTGGDAWVRTLGGIVGKIGQIVDGEAVFSPGRASLVFVRPSASGALDVTARGQGQFPVVAGSGAGAPPTLLRSRSSGFILPRPKAAPTAGKALPPLAADVLHGRAVEDAAHDVATAWGTYHAP